MTTSTKAPDPVELARIRFDGGTQARAKLDEQYCRDLVEVLDELPPPIVYFDGQDYWPGDGWHRLRAHFLDDRKTVLCEVRQGTRRDAVLFSLGANVQHDKSGLRRTNADKRRAVETALRDPEWSRESDTWIAAQCCVSDRFVSGVRKELSPNDSGMRVVRRGDQVYEAKTRRSPEEELQRQQEADAEAAMEGFDARGAAPVTEELTLRLPVLEVRLYDKLPEERQQGLCVAFGLLIRKAGRKKSA